MNYSNKADSVIQFFMDRKGFDNWYNDIDEETEDEIKKELSELLEELFKKNQDYNNAKI